MRKQEKKYVATANMYLYLSVQWRTFVWTNVSLSWRQVRLTWFPSRSSKIIIQPNKLFVLCHVMEHFKFYSWVGIITKAFSANIRTVIAKSKLCAYTFANRWIEGLHLFPDEGLFELVKLHIFCMLCMFHGMKLEIFRVEYVWLDADLLTWATDLVSFFFFFRFNVSMYSSRG